jgi:hemolysin D
MGRYLTAVKAGIEQSKKPRRKLGRTEREFQAASLEILETPSSITARLFTFAIMVFVVAAAAWSWLGRIDTHASLQGKIIPIGKVKVVEPLITGTVKALHVKLGDHVNEGDLLVELDPAENVAEMSKVRVELELATLSSAKLRAMLEAVERGAAPDTAGFLQPPNTGRDIYELQLQHMRRALVSFASEQSSIDAELAKVAVEAENTSATLEQRHKLIDLTSEKTGIFSALEKKKLGLRTDALEAKRTEQDLRVTLTAEEGHLADLMASAKAMVARKAERLAAFQEKTVTDLVESERHIAALTQELAKVEVLERSSRLTAPVAGHVQQLQVNTLGQVVTTGRQLMVIVPDNSLLEIEAMLLNRDKGFVREGQAARVKLDAFPFTKYGTLDGQVIGVSNDAVSANASQSASNGGDAQAATGPLVFPVRISLGEKSINVEGDTVNLTPGMSVQAEVKTGSRRVIEFLLDPLLRMTDEAFHER